MKLMKKLGLLFAVAIVGIGAALTYHVFENAVHGAINYIWYDTFNTDTYRWIVIPLTLVFTFIFFGLQHYLDPKSEKSEEHGLGNMPTPTVVNFLKVMLIGFFSLVAGATLGPEAILVPACMILGAFVGTKLFTKDKQITQLLAAAGLMALFTAFFDSFWVGVLSLLLVLAQSKTKFKPMLLVVAIIAAGSAKLTLNAVEGEAYAPLPNNGWHINIETVVFSLALVIGGFIAVHAMSQVHGLIDKLRKKHSGKNWLIHASIAATGLIVLVLIGGPLVEFTGNKSIEPVFSQAAELGLVGLVWILVVKIIAISWSKAIGYRGGMIFPTIFVAAVMVAIVQLYVSDFNMIYGIIAVLVGAFAANKKTHILV